MKSKVLPINETHILLWSKRNDLKKLHWALKHGNYQIRAKVAKTLEQIGSKMSLPILVKSVNDKVFNVSISVLNALETIDTEFKYTSLIYLRRFKWATLKQKTQNKVKTNKKHNIYRWERSSKKSFEIVKERLKRPIR